MPSFTSHESRNGGSPTRVRIQQQFFSDFSTVVSPGKPSHARHPHIGKPNQFDSDQSLLEMLHSTVACLKQKNMDLEALGCLEQSLWLKRRMFGVDNSVVQRALNDVVLSYNSVAMQYLAQAQFDQCLAMLRKAEAITAPGNFRKCQSLQILTFNNIGCCYRKLGKLKSALKYLKEAAQVGSTCAHVKNLSITHLNLCAIQSQLGRHDLALEHAQAAIFHTQEELVGLEAAVNSSRRCDDDSEYDDGAASSSPDVLDAKSREEKVISLAVAYHNLAVELEFNGRGEASLQWYKKALQLVWKYRESNAALCASFKKIFTDAKSKFEAQRSGGAASGHRGPRSTTNNSRAASQHASTGFASDRQKPTGRPQSAHHSSRGDRRGGGGAPPAATTTGNDLSYSANVASQCYKPMKPSSAGLQYASPPKGRTPGDCTTASRTQRLLSTNTSAPSSFRQRPVSASASRSRVAKEDASNTEAGASIESHWKRLEREFAIKDTRNGVTTTAQATVTSRTPQPQSRATKRPQSARLTTARVESSSLLRQPHDGGAFSVHCSANISDLEGDSDGDVLGDDDDELSETEDADAGKSDSFADFLLRRDSDAHQNQGRQESDASCAAQQQFSRGHWHHQALNTARQRPVVLKAKHDESDTSSTLSEANDGGDGGDLPHQRVSHMEYLRRMKRLAENIKDDLVGAPASDTAAPHPGSPSQRVLGARTETRNSAGGSSTTREKDGVTTTPRGSTSKVRERLERVRSESSQRLPGCDAALDYITNSVGGVADASPTTKMSSSLKSGAVQATADEFVEVIESGNNTLVDATEQELRAAEDALVRTVAAKHIQAVVRGERARASVQRKRQVRSTVLRVNDEVVSHVVTLLGTHSSLSLFCRRNNCVRRRRSRVSSDRQRPLPRRSTRLSASQRTRTKRMHHHSLRMWRGSQPLRPSSSSKDGGRTASYCRR